MLVRAKRLEFSPVGEGMNQSAEALGLTYVVRPAFCGGWEWWLCLKTECKPAASLADAIVACQSDFDRRWRESTEVPDLVWTPSELDNGAEILISGRYHISRTGTAFDKWEAQFDYQTIAEDVASEDLAKLACNAHNRAAVLGE